MKNNSLSRILFLLKLLSQGTYSKNDIISEFKKQNIIIQKTSINNYIKKLEQNDIKIKTNKIKNENFYTLDTQGSLIEFQDIELNVADDVKKFISNEKNINIIRYIMRTFYKIALQTQNSKARQQLANFGYFSKINWALVRQIMYHCKNKNLITLDYILPGGTNRELTIHADTIKMGSWSDRIYLFGVLKNDYKFSQLPLDNILTVKKIEKEHLRFDMEVDILVYKVSKSIYNTVEKDKKETISEEKNGILTIKRPIDDNFSLIQRLLYFCPELYYISDFKIKQIIKEKLYILKGMYENDD
ncbi:hypothetical protein IJ670_00255 [bacterium]|nr:hypothetical protein [bacterium]